MHDNELMDLKGLSFRMQNRFCSMNESNSTNTTANQQTTGICGNKMEYFIRSFNTNQLTCTDM